MNAQTLYDKLWNAHVVRKEADGTALIYIDRHLVHEVTSPQAFEGLKLSGRKLWRAASMPFMLGMVISNTATSGFRASARATASLPSLASPTT